MKKMPTLRMNATNKHMKLEHHLPWNHHANTLNIEPWCNTLKSLNSGLQFPRCVLKDKRSHKIQKSGIYLDHIPQNNNKTAKFSKKRLTTAAYRNHILVALS